MLTNSITSCLLVLYCSSSNASHLMSLILNLVSYHFEGLRFRLGDGLKSVIMSSLPNVIYLSSMIFTNLIFTFLLVTVNSLHDPFGAIGHLYFYFNYKLKTWGFGVLGFWGYVELWDLGIKRFV